MITCLRSNAADDGGGKFLLFRIDINDASMGPCDLGDDVAQ